MRLLETEGERPLDQVQLYLSPAEARKLLTELAKLLTNPEASEHFHVYSEDDGVDLSCSIVTAKKLAGGGYTPGERKAFGRWKPRG